MGDSTGISWADATWNPMTGCTEVSAGCDNCYAAVLARRPILSALYLAQPPARDTPANRADPFAPRFWPERLRQPYAWRRPRRVFVNSMTDVFHAQFTQDQIRQVFLTISGNPQHQFQLLTKRPERAARLAPTLPWPPNLWLGVSIENEAVMHRANTLRTIPAAVRFISYEPALGPLDALDLAGIHWLIYGGESGPSRRPDQDDWAVAVGEKCAQSGTAFYYKQTSALRSGVVPTHLQYLPRDYPKALGE